MWSWLICGNGLQTHIHLITIKSMPVLKMVLDLGLAGWGHWRNIHTWWSSQLLSLSLSSSFAHFWHCQWQSIHCSHRSSNVVLKASAVLWVVPVSIASTNKPLPWMTTDAAMTGSFWMVLQPSCFISLFVQPLLHDGLILVTAFVYLFVAGGISGRLLLPRL